MHPYLRQFGPYKYYYINRGFPTPPPLYVSSKTKHFYETIIRNCCVSLNKSASNFSLDASLKLQPITKFCNV